MSDLIVHVLKTMSLFGGLLILWIAYETGFAPLGFLAGAVLIATQAEVR